LTKNRQRRNYDLGSAALLGPWRRWLAVSVSLVIMLFNLTASYMLPPVRGLTSETATTSGSLLGERIVICTARGAAVVNADGTPLDPKNGMPPGAAHGGLCACCLPMMAGALTPPDGLTDPPVFFAQRSKPPIPHQVTGHRFDTGPVHARPRAPPQTTPISV